MDHPARAHEVRARAQGAATAALPPDSRPSQGNSERQRLHFSRPLGQHEVTAHGFRSSFRDWASECTSFPREVCELALAHVIDDKTEAAYRRGDLLEKRRELMSAWAAFATSALAGEVTSSPSAVTSNVPV